MQLDTINKLSEIVERDYNPMMVRDANNVLNSLVDQVESLERQVDDLRSLSH